MEFGQQVPEYLNKSQWLVEENVVMRVRNTLNQIVTQQVLEHRS
jgi:hypothetical protein